MVYHRENVVVLRIIFFQSIRNGDQIALKSIQGVFLIQYHWWHFLNLLLQLQLFELADFAGWYEVFEVLTAKWKPKSLVELLEAIMFIVVENAVDRVKYLFVPVSRRNLFPQMASLPAQVPKFILRVSFRYFETISLSVSYRSCSERPVSVEITHRVRNMDYFEHPPHPHIILLPLHNTLPLP